MRRGRQLQDLFQDLRDGQNLITLLEMLSGQNLPRERGRMRVHQLQNIQIALNYIKFRKVKLVNIRPEDIVDGNQKLTLGLIWTIILHFQVSTKHCVLFYESARLSPVLLLLRFSQIYIIVISRSMILAQLILMKLLTPELIQADLRTYS